MDRNDLDFRLVAYHRSAPLSEIVYSLGDGSLQLDSGQYSAFGDKATEATWVSKLFSIRDSLEWNKPLSWLDEHRAKIHSLIESGWTIEAEVRIIARDPIVRCPLPGPFINWLANIPVPFQIIVSPRPILLDDRSPTSEP